MKVLSGVYPHGSYEGRILYAGQEARFRGIHDSEAAGIVIIHQELRWCRSSASPRTSSWATSAPAAA
jgi:ABC-type sugar transport system ATPase subunit